MKELMTSKPAIIQDTKYITRVKVMGIDTSGGWYYKACSECPLGIKPEGNIFRCRKHGPTTPQLTMCLSLDLEDNTCDMDAVVFGGTADITTGKNLDFPEEAKRIIGRTYDMALGLTPQGKTGGTLSYKIFGFKEITNNKNTSGSTQLTSAPHSTDDKPPSDLFPEESPTKKTKLSTKAMGKQPLNLQR